MTFPRNSGKQFRHITPKFTILNDNLVEFISLHMLVYRKSFKSTLRWIPINLRGMVDNTYWITLNEYEMLERQVDEKAEEYEKISRNTYKRMYRRLLQELEAE